MVWEIDIWMLGGRGLNVVVDVYRSVAEAVEMWLLKEDSVDDTRNYPLTGGHVLGTWTLWWGRGNPGFRLTFW